MKTINELRKLLQPISKITQGVVMEKTASTVVLSSEAGRVELFVANVSQFPIGATVRYRDGVILGISTDPKNLTIYHV